MIQNLTEENTILRQRLDYKDQQGPKSVLSEEISSIPIKSQEKFNPQSILSGQSSEFRKSDSLILKENDELKYEIIKLRAEHNEHIK